MAIPVALAVALSGCAGAPAATTTTTSPRPTESPSPTTEPTLAATAAPTESAAAVDDSPAARPLLVPAAVAARPALPFCGHETVVRGIGGDVGDPEPWECLIAALDAGAAAELIRDSFTIEGGPVRSIVRVLADGRIDWWDDSTQDAFGGRAWSRQVCGRLATLRTDPANPPVYRPEDCGDPEVVVDATNPDAPSGDEMAMLEALVLFARDPAERTLDDVPLDPDGVWLGLADDVALRLTPDELADPRAWSLDAEAFRGRVGPFSALGLLGDWNTGAGGSVREASVTVGEHPHCASAPVPPPAEAAGLRHLSVQPVGADSCLSWWTVDLFVDERGTIEVITLDLYEP